MKSWILPTVAVAAVIFLMTRPGRDLQEDIGDHFGDWVDNVIRSTHKLQQSLNHVQSVLERCSRTLQQVGG